MKFLVLGLTGKRGCGKDTVANYLREEHGFAVLTYTDHVLAPILEKRGKPVTRENLISLALELREKHGKDILTKMICGKIEKSGLWAVSGVRYPEEAERFRKEFGDDFRLLSIECSAEKRHERVKSRGTKGEGELTYKEFLRIDKRPTELPISETMKLADFTIENNGPFEDLYKQINNLMENLL